MNIRAVVGLSIFVMLIGCERQQPIASPNEHGRYIGVGVFNAGVLWSRIIADKLTDNAAATMADDEHIIVAIDSNTGEIRECGDYSGRCVSMNPWTKAIAAGERAPVKLSEHMSDMGRKGASSRDDPPTDMDRQSMSLTH